MQNLKSNKRGQGLVEYIVLICLVAVALFTVVQQMASTTRTKFQKANTTIGQL